MSNNIAIYRRYRPKSFSELIGQNDIAEILMEAARQDRFAHAYLFAGPRGTGKTTTARLVAKTLNCLTRDKDPKFKSKGEPCNKCSACLKINEGRNMDIIEIDAASNRGIDEIRNLKENVRVSPSESKYKVFIIDEAHMLTKAAFNALLKTLEEPPKYVVMILATTEMEKIPATITSRTQQFFFKRVGIRQITEKLQRIAKESGIKASTDSLELIASAAEGSFRDAESLFDQLIAVKGGEIKVDDVEKIIGRVGFDTLNLLALKIAEKDIDSVLEKIGEIFDKGYDLTELTSDLIHHLRKVVVLSFSPQMKSRFKNEMTSDHLDKIEKISHKMDESHLAVIKNLISAYSQMRYSRFPIIPLEVALIESLK